LEGNSFPGNGKKKMTAEESEIARLQKELAEIRMERDILKKAVGIFSKSDGKFFNS
jgi:transposase